MGEGEGEGEGEERLSRTSKLSFSNSLWLSRLQGWRRRSGGGGGVEEEGPGQEGWGSGCRAPV